MSITWDSTSMYDAVKTQFYVSDDWLILRSLDGIEWDCNKQDKNFKRRRKRRKWQTERGRGRGRERKRKRRGWKERKWTNCRWVIYYAALSRTSEDNRLIFREKRIRAERNGLYVWGIVDISFATSFLRGFDVRALIAPLRYLSRVMAPAPDGH